MAKIAENEKHPENRGFFRGLPCLGRRGRRFESSRPDLKSKQLVVFIRGKLFFFESRVNNRPSKIMQRGRHAIFVRWVWIPFFTADKRVVVDRELGRYDIGRSDRQRLSYAPTIQEK